MYEVPADTGFTIYTKSGCPNCRASKAYLDAHFYTYKVVDSDDALVENREEFLLFLREHAQQDVKVFPVIFCDKRYIGSFSELKAHVQTLQENFEETFSF